MESMLLAQTGSDIASVYFVGILLILIVAVYALRKISAKHTQKTKQSEFQSKVEEAYHNAANAYSLINSPKSRYTQVEIAILSPMLQEYWLCERQIKSGTVPIDIDNKLNSLAESFRIIYQNRTLPDQDTDQKNNAAGEPERDSEKKSTEIHYFAGCETETAIRKRYRNLSKALHPDTEAGDKGMFEAMKEEYRQALKSVSKQKPTSF